MLFVANCLMFVVLVLFVDHCCLRCVVRYVFLLCVVLLLRIVNNCALLDCGCVFSVAVIKCCALMLFVVCCC